MPRVPTLDAPTIAHTTTAAQRFAAPDVVQPVAPNGARFNAQAQEIRVDTSREKLAEQANRSLGQAVDAVTKIQMEAIERADQLRVNAALSEATKARLALTYDPEQGFAHLKGEAALNRPDKRSLQEEYGERFDKSIEGIMQSLGNPRQQRIFAEKAAALRDQFSNGIMQHVAREYPVYALGQQDGIIADQITRIATEFGDHNAVQDAIEGIKAATYEQGRIKGLTGDQIKMAIRENLSQAHSIALKKIVDLPGMEEFAEEYLKTHSDDMTPNARLAATKLVNEGKRQVFTQRTSDELYDKHNGDMKAIMAEVRREYQGDQRQDLESHLKARNTAERQFEKQAEDDAMEAVLDKLSMGQRPSNSEMAALSGRDRLSINNMMRDRSEGKAQKTNIQAWLAWADVPPEQKAQMSTADLYRMMGPHLSDADLKAAARDIEKSREAMKKGDPPGLVLDSINETVNRAARDLGFMPADPRKRMSQSQMEDVTKFKDTLQARITDLEQRTGKKAGQEEIKGIVDDMKLDVVRVRGKMFGTSDLKPLVTLSEKEMPRAVITVRGKGGGVETVSLAAIPEAARARLEAKLRDAALPIRAMDVAQAWVLEGKPRQ